MLLRTAVSVVTLVGLLVVVTSQDEVSLQGPNGLQAHCSRKGARITVYRNVSNDTSTGKIIVSFDELSELNDAGTPVSGQSGGKGKHVYSAFDKEDFAITGPTDAVLDSSNRVNASCLAVTASLQNVSGATFSGQVCAVMDDGMLYLGEENSTVSAGQLKFTVAVSNWVWATDGKYLQLKINIKIPPGRSISADGGAGGGRKLPKKFLFGGGAVANFSTQVKVDDTWSAMPTGYPMYDRKGANNYITIRIPRFNTSGEYDPTIDPGSSPDMPSKGSFILQSSISVAIVCHLVAVELYR